MMSPGVVEWCAGCVGVALGLAGPRKRFPQTDPKGWWAGLVCVRLWVWCAGHAEPCRCFNCLAPAQGERRTLDGKEGAWSKRRWARCAGCRMRIILSECPFGGLGGQGKAGRRHFALIVFAPHLQFWNGFLTWPVFADTIILARFGNDKTRRIAEGPVSGKGRTECLNAGTVNHGTKRSVCCGRVLGPFNVPMAVDGRGFHFPAVSTTWQQQW